MGPSAPLTPDAASLGGRARAEKLDASQRSEIARRAAEARWGTLPVATHCGRLTIGDRSIDCAVLDDGTRVINQGTFLSALERNPEKSRRGEPGAKRAPFLAAANLQPFISEQLRGLDDPIQYRMMGTNAKAWGYRAEMLPLVCEVYLQARDVQALAKSQEPVAKVAEILIRGLAQVGIIALVDEATGYQETRDRQELRKILERYVQAELRPWLRMFPEEFFGEVSRLHGWEVKPGARRPSYVGRFINRYVYDQLPPGVHDELRRLNPRTDKGWRAHKHHQFLTADTGNVHLDKQVGQVTMLMRIARTKQEFEDLFERAFPPPEPRLPLVIDVS